MKKTILITTFLLLAACGSEVRSIHTLGSGNDFSDANINDDFAFSINTDETQVASSQDSTVEVVNPNSPSFHFDQKNISLAHGKAYRWNGCNKSYFSQGGFNSNTKCGRGYFHPKMATNLNSYFHRCISDAAKKAGYPQPQRIFIKHFGTYHDRNARNSSRLSNHAYARAIDISDFDLYDNSGKRYRVSTLLRNYKGSQAKFYDEFRQCWHESLPSNCRRGKTEYLGSIGHKKSKLGGNTLHNDHIHLSLPLCAG